MFSMKHNHARVQATTAVIRTKSKDGRGAWEERLALFSLFYFILFYFFSRRCLLTERLEQAINILYRQVDLKMDQHLEIFSHLKRRPYPVYFLDLSRA